jgi:hypothetical protein
MDTLSLQQLRKIVISALFFSKYLVLWKYRSSKLPRKSDNILKYADYNDINYIFDEILKDIAIGFGLYKTNNGIFSSRIGTSL